MEAPLFTEDRGPARWIWFNRPEVHNAQDTAMLERLVGALDAVPEDPMVRVVVLAGKGPSFCSGHDLKEIVRHPDYSKAVETVEGRLRWEQRLFVDPVLRFRELPVPTIAMIHGSCLAAGLMFAAVADFVFATPNARFASPIIPAMSINDAEVPSFAWLVGSRRAKEVLWLSETMDAEAAREAGLVTRVVEQSLIEQEIGTVVDALSKIPSETLLLSKLSMRDIDDQKGFRSSATYHFLSHSLSHHTTGALDALSRRKQSTDNNTETE